MKFLFCAVLVCARSRPCASAERGSIDCSHKRGWAALYNGVDIRQPRGAPIRAVADGTVVGGFLNDFNPKGIEIVLRRTPAPCSDAFGGI